jgi:hypothetical protein
VRPLLNAAMVHPSEASERMEDYGVDVQGYLFE